MRFLLILIALMLGLGSAAGAQDKATLIADRVALNGNDTLVASGHVEVFYRGQRLSAGRIVFDQGRGRLLIEGPIVLSDGSGTVILASQAELSSDLTEGILTSARLVLQQQFQLAAAQMVRLDGRYTALNKVVASSCQVCKANPVPLWEIRAASVVHDEARQQLYFDKAQFRLAGVPIAYIPRLRLPDPSLKRASGFLIPSFRSSSLYGTGIRVPYFFRIGDHRDLTVTPFISDKGTRSVDLRYRQAFVAGDIEISGTLTQDSLSNQRLRGYGYGQGHFDLPQDFKLDFFAEFVSDDAYLLDYGIAEKDRLESRVEVSRVRREDYISANAIGLHSLRPGEKDSTQPVAIADLTWSRRFALGPLGGAGTLTFQNHGHLRPSTEALQDRNGDGIADGRDLRRMSLRADWRRNFLLSGGVQVALVSELAADYFASSQDKASANNQGRAAGALAAELRWPWLKTSANGNAHVIEPIVQLIFGPGRKSSVLNEDSVLVEFDEGSLFALNRFPGADAVETGVRANIGVNYLITDPKGWSLGVTAGRVIRKDDPKVFGTGSGLSGLKSDWMAAWQVNSDKLQLTNRLLFDDGFAINKAELQARYTGERIGLEVGYVQLEADASENRLDPIRELSLASSYKVFDLWTASLSSRYDFKTKRAAKAGVGLKFHNECLLVDLSLSRRFTSSTSVAASTDVGLTVELLGFGGGTAPGATRQCRN